MDEYNIDSHLSQDIRTPLKKQTENLTDSDKISFIENNVKEILEVLGMDLGDDSLRGTPKRVAKMYVKEMFAGLNPKNRPKASTFKNKYKYGEILLEKNIKVYSTCEHHLLPVIGKAHVAYISTGSVIGLSKINRIVNYYAKRPQVQERMTKQIVEELKYQLDSESVACIIDAKHLCVNSRGINDVDCSTVTSEYHGVFKDIDKRQELFECIKLNTKF